MTKPNELFQTFKTFLSLTKSIFFWGGVPFPQIMSVQGGWWFSSILSNKVAKMQRLW